MDHHGIYVAFDAAGKHFAYARHPNDCPEFKAAQQREVAGLRRHARRAGGRVDLLSREDYQRVVLAK